MNSVVSWPVRVRVRGDHPDEAALSRARGAREPEAQRCGCTVARHPAIVAVAGIVVVMLVGRAAHRVDEPRGPSPRSPCSGRSVRCKPRRRRAADTAAPAATPTASSATARTTAREDPVAHFPTLTQTVAARRHGETTSEALTSADLDRIDALNQHLGR
ncbi:hypothetical protein QJS66_10325 [Kocuria rhizophila]|nr:hypothetical protein QJS66_10325 [Kocuria rhizophila]